MLDIVGVFESYDIDIANEGKILDAVKKYNPVSLLIAGIKKVIQFLTNSLNKLMAKWAKKHGYDDKDMHENLKLNNENKRLEEDNKEKYVDKNKFVKLISGIHADIKKCDEMLSLDINRSFRIIDAISKDNNIRLGEGLNAEKNNKYDNLYDKLSRKYEGLGRLHEEYVYFINSHSPAADEVMKTVHRVRDIVKNSIQHNIEKLKKLLKQIESNYTSSNRANFTQKNADKSESNVSKLIGNLNGSISKISALTIKLANLL